MLRRVGMGKMRDILLELSKDPAMIFWLDNNENRKGEPNENYGRELLELFSLGVGNYSEDDIKSCALAFTGWTFGQPIPLYPHGYYSPPFLFVEEEHDNGDKTFLGHTGNLNGDDIIDIIVEQPACARFVSRHLYNFFVADEPQVPSWNVTPPARSRSDRDTLKRIYGVRWAYLPRSECPFQFRFLQRSPIQEGQEPDGTRHGDTETGRHLPRSATRNGAICRCYAVDGTETSRSTHRRRLAHR